MIYGKNLRFKVGDVVKITTRNYNLVDKSPLTIIDLHEYIRGSGNTIWTVGTSYGSTELVYDKHLELAKVISWKNEICPETQCKAL